MALWPYRSPLVVIEIIKDIISGKSVCHLGCREGDILEGMNNHAKELFGIEITHRWANSAKRKGFAVKHGDYFKCEIPEAEVYYMWPHLGHMSKLLDRICFDLKYDCTFLIGFGGLPSPGKDDAINLCKNRGGYIVERPNPEDNSRTPFHVLVITAEEYRSTKP